MAAAPPGEGFGAFVKRARARGALVVQPRMGFSDPQHMRAGLLATKNARGTTVGTITLDSYTRIGDHSEIEKSLQQDIPLNGYPIVSHPLDVTTRMLDGVASVDFPVQVRHGSPAPAEIFQVMGQLGLTATEGGPVSYCIPYGRTPLIASIRNWARCCEAFSQSTMNGKVPHMETFGGCMLGQLCPPGQLIAISVLEALFFREHGLRSVSLSYAQQTNMAQDHEAVLALRRLCGELLADMESHIVVYSYMGLHPRTESGSAALLADAVELAVTAGADRLVVKTSAEADRIPTIEENVSALNRAAAAACGRWIGVPRETPADSQAYLEARVLIDTVRNLDDDLGRALVAAFQRGYLDVPYCLHPDNAGRARSCIASDGRLLWTDLGALPLREITGVAPSQSPSAAGLLNQLTYVRRKFDHPSCGLVFSRDFSFDVEADGE
ncbi:hypothetical protein [Frankia sp. B2]|uniref:hypothetical protein n=1 Tax=Frankia sp. B2 TaxID=2541730 RepID=UPI001F0FAC17|nr:hypothetical protein [Frankia sp. B2]